MGVSGGAVLNSVLQRGPLEIGAIEEILSVQSDVFILQKIKFLCPDRGSQRLCNDPPGTKGSQGQLSYKKLLALQRGRKASVHSSKKKHVFLQLY